jgi:hypothetical protein
MESGDSTELLTLPSPERVVVEQQQQQQQQQQQSTDENDFDVEFVALRTGRFRSKLWTLIVILSLGSALAIAHWFPLLYSKCRKRRVHFREADSVLAKVH